MSRSPLELTRRYMEAFYGGFDAGQMRAILADDYGAQSLSNLVEVLGLFAAAVTLAYAKVFAVDRLVRRPRAATYALLALLAFAALLLRTFMPVLPE